MHEQCWAQNRTIDSLKLALKNAKHDTTGVKLLINLGFKIHLELPDSAIKLWNRAISLADQGLLKYSKSSKEYAALQISISNAYSNLGALYKKSGEMEKAMECHNKSLKIREAIGYKKGIAQSLNNLGTVYVKLGNTSKALECYSKSLVLKEELGEKKDVASTLNNLGNLYKRLGQIDKSIDCFSKSLQLFEKFGDRSGASAAWSNLAITYYMKGNVPKALDYFSRSLKIREQIGDRAGMASGYNDLAIIYNDQGEFEKGLEYFNKSLKIREMINDKEGVSQCYINIGSLYKDQDDYSIALDYYQRALKIKEEINDKPELADVLNNIGNVYSDINNKNKALEYYIRSLKIQQEIEDSSGIANSLINIANIYREKKDYKNAIKYANNAMRIGKALGYPEIIEVSAANLNEMYKATGDFRLALENYELYIKMSDSLNNIETQKATIKQQTKYEYDKQKAIADEKHLAEIKQQEEKAAAEKKRQNIVIASVSVVLLLVAVFSVILFNRFRVTQKQKAVIELKEKETQLQKHIIEEKHKEITDSINYAERIQRSFLATQTHLDNYLSEYFILFQPKDIVSGDFYWSATLNNHCFALATADSTGHGVPGAIMSLLNITSLEKAIETETFPDQILNATRKTIIERLKKDGSPEGGKDGMDCSLCVFDFKNKKLFVANANNPVWIVRGPETIEVKGDKMPVGKHDKQDVPFTFKEYDLQKGDVVYTLTDGFPDQFGGEKGKKFMSKNLRELLASNANLSMYEQKSLLEKTFKDWVGDLEQVDDVTVIGIRV